MMVRLQEGDPEEDQEKDELITFISNRYLYTTKPVQ